MTVAKTTPTASLPPPPKPAPAPAAVAAPAPAAAATKSPVLGADKSPVRPQAQTSSLVLGAVPASRPAADTGKTWGGPDSTTELNFGHKPDAQGRLYKVDPSGVPVWCASGKAITPDQWANMPKFQQDAIAATVPEVGRAALLQEMAKGDAKQAWREKPQLGLLAFQGNFNFNFDPNITDGVKAEMQRMAELAIQNSAGKKPDGDCYRHVADYLEKFGVKYGAFGAGAPALSGLLAKNFVSLVDANPAAHGLTKLPLDNPYQAPPGAIVVVRPGTPGTKHKTAGDIAVATGKGWFANGGEMGYGGSQNFPPGNDYVLGIYMPA